jgi:Bacterial SH3 domain
VTPGRRRGRFLILGAAMTAGLAACGVPGTHSARKAPPPVTTATAPSTTVAKAAPVALRTVLSPIGLHVRGGPSTSAKILGTAAEGVTLEELGRSGDGQWIKVKGATVTGWIDASPTLSAPGQFTAFTSTVHSFGALYPVSWTAGESRAEAVFRAPAATGESIVVTTAATTAKLSTIPADYQESQSQEIVACGVTSDLNTYTLEGVSPSTATAAKTSGPAPYLAQILLQLNPKHALGIEANLTALAQLQSVRDFANSVTFPFPACEG